MAGNISMGWNESMQARYFMLRVQNYGQSEVVI